ncbi:hypothetical protein [Synechococcus sp. GFB01]|uniref:hypothetical protein n=1 Tax=Synechococcus sp. GFB01 TaxID=1662190 RepID=UPI00064FFB5F|nr:hypothetical protein [Synechococcus sp. GFB01]KMM17645.1 hypothetical protein SYNGFB01_02785 [Synechococcus sp. GFB01]
MLKASEAGVAAELIFDAAYLVMLWMLVLALAARLRRSAPPARWCGGPLAAAFGLLALGDTAHVGLRLVALGLGDPGLTLRLGPVDLPLIGFGALATAVTVTGFDLLLLQAQRRLSGRGWGLLPRALLALALLRLALLALPQNDWGAVIPPQPWAALRNLPLLLLTLGLGGLYGCASGPDQRWQRAIGGLLLFSALCHLPVLLWIQRQPLLGLLMIPKSLAYLAVGLIAYRRLPSMAPISSR